MIQSLFLNQNRFVFAALLLAALSLSAGCVTFGTFSNLTQNQTTSDEVRELLGEPEKIQTEENHEIWTYTFIEPSRSKQARGTLKALETEIIFQDGIITNYHITVVTRAIPIDKKPRPGFGSGQPGGQELNPNARRFLKKFDANNDNQITRKEYSGPPKLFNLIDSNHDNLLEFNELKGFPFKK